MRALETEVDVTYIQYTAVEENVKYAYIDKKICRGGNEPIDSVA